METKSREIIGENPSDMEPSEAYIQMSEAVAVALRYFRKDAATKGQIFHFARHSGFTSTEIQQVYQESLEEYHGEDF